MKILLLEDDRKLAGPVRKGLEAEGFSVDYCHSGDEAYTLASTRAYDALVLDLMVRVSLTCTAAHALITVGNTGPGIPGADRPRLFERFYRGDPARVRDRASGVGLGLSLSREILRAHGGDLVLQPAAEDWTEFVASLPRAGLNGTTHSP